MHHSSSLVWGGEEEICIEILIAKASFSAPEEDKKPAEKFKFDFFGAGSCGKMKNPLLFSQQGTRH
jgi:hypothetical protein